MKQGQSSKRARGRNGGRRGGGGNRQQVFDSNGPSVRIRGNAFQVYEKYLALARDAASAGDRIGAENYYQHAEHYFRIYSAEVEERNLRAGGNGHTQHPQDGLRRIVSRGQRPNGRLGGNGANGEQPRLSGDDELSDDDVSFTEIPAATATMDPTEDAGDEASEDRNRGSGD